MILLEDNKSDVWSPRKLLFFLFFIAFSLRFGFGVFKYYFGIPFLDIVPVNWWGSGYSQYSEIAINFVEGKGLTSSPGSDGFVHAMRPPLYPLFLSVFYFCSDPRPEGAPDPYGALPRRRRASFLGSFWDD